MGFSHPKSPDQGGKNGHEAGRGLGKPSPLHSVLNLPAPDPDPTPLQGIDFSGRSTCLPWHGQQSRA